MDKQKIFDAFVAVEKKAVMRIGLQINLDGPARADLADLLSELSYLGRSESLVSARLCEVNDDAEFNCFPALSNTAGRKEIVNVACLCSGAEYDALAEKPMQTTGKGPKRVEAPISWLAALCLSTPELLSAGWSAPPCLRYVQYMRSASSLAVQQQRHTSNPLAMRFGCAHYALSSTVLPRVTETVAFAERVRSRLMGIHRGVSGGDPASVSPRFSGKGEGGTPAFNHEHAFYLPLDEDSDGRIDHLLIRTAVPFNSSELKALDNLTSIWQPQGKPDVRLVLVGLTSEPSSQTSQRWISATPFVTKRHHRKGRGDFWQWLGLEVRRECANHGLPAPRSVEWLSETRHLSHPLRWAEFFCSRKEGQRLRGHGCVLEFDEPIKGPLVLGALCHFGLGLFLPVLDS